MFENACPPIRFVAKFARPLTFHSIKLALIIGLFLTVGNTTWAQSALDGFDPNADNVVRAVAVQPGGKILIGGDFTSVQGVARNRIARLNADGTVDTAFNPNANGIVRSIQVQPGRENSGGRRIHQHRRTGAQPHCPTRNKRNRRRFF